MMVIDASAAISMVRDAEDGGMLDRIAEMGEKAIAPDFFRVEVSQVAWKYVHVGIIDEQEAQIMLRATIGCVEEFVNDKSLVIEALHEAIAKDHSFYDMLYFVLARRTSSTLLTCDRRLAAICREGNVECIELCAA